MFVYVRHSCPLLLAWVLNWCPIYSAQLHTSANQTSVQGSNWNAGKQLQWMWLTEENNNKPWSVTAVYKVRRCLQRFIAMKEVTEKWGEGGKVMKKETGRMVHQPPWCSRPASNYARCLSFCLPACYPSCQFSRDREAVNGAEMSGADAGAARGKSAGHRSSQLKVTWPFDFVTCHQLPCLTLHWGVPAIHSCFPLPLSCRHSVSKNASLSFSVSCAHSIFLSHSPCLSRVAFLWGKVEVWLSVGDVV